MGIKPDKEEKKERREKKEIPSWIEIRRGQFFYNVTPTHRLHRERKNTPSSVLYPFRFSMATKRATGNLLLLRRKSKAAGVALAGPYTHLTAGGETRTGSTGFASAGATSSFPPPIFSLIFPIDTAAAILRLWVVLVECCGVWPSPNRWTNFPSCGDSAPASSAYII